MKDFMTISGIILSVLGCATPDRRIDSNYSNLTDNREAMYGLNMVLESSEKDAPAWVTSYLDMWDCEQDFCVVGRAEISADDTSPYTCLDVARLKAKANLVSVIQTDISNKVIMGSEGTNLSHQELKNIVVEGFEVRNLSNIKTTKNYFQKVLKHAGESPRAFYQCFSVASLSKLNLQNLITREADKRLGHDKSQEFQKQLRQEWDRFFKLDGDNTRPPGVHQSQDRQAFSQDLMQGGLDNIRDNVRRVATAFLNLPYQLGGDISDGVLDCSNYVRTVYSVFGLHLPRTSVEQFGDVRGDVVGDDLMVGDLVFFNGVLRPSDQPSHVGIYLGNGKFINANGNADARKIQIDDFTSDYWQGKFLGAKRFIHQQNFQSPTVASSH